MAVICSSGIERDLIVDDPWDRVDALERELNRLTRAVPTTGGSGGGTNGGTTISIPIGGIIMWAGAVEDVPEGWALCDGDNGTPDLRNSFIVAAGDTYAVGDTGGEDESDLSHTHGVSGNSGYAGGHTHTSAGGHTHDTISDHTHLSGTYATDAEAAHNHSIAWESSHDHGDTDGPSSTTTWGNSNTPPGPAKGDGTHTHNIPADGGHNHGAATGNEGGHSHDVTGSSGSGGGHTHSSAGSHTHNTISNHRHSVSITSDSGGAADQENRPVYYALALIMKVA